MPRLSINEMTTLRWSFEEDVARYRAAGVSAMGVWRQKVSDYGEEKAIELLAESRMGVSNLLWAGGFTGSDGHTYRESIEDAEDAIRLAAVMQAGCLVVYTGARRGHTRNHAQRLIHGALRELAPLAEDLEVTLAIEPMHSGCATEWTFLSSLSESLELVRAIESPQMGLVFDTYHLGFDPNIVDLVPAIADQIAIVHLGDGRHPPDGEQNRCRLGEGCVPLGELMGALSAAGYQGDYDVELMGEDVEAIAYEDLLADSQQAFARLSPVASS
jgi:sugar phosphate isomerase/epimerase